MIVQTTLLVAGLALGSPPDPIPGALSFRISGAHYQRAPRSHRTEFAASLRIDLWRLLRASRLPLPAQERRRRRACAQLPVARTPLQQRAVQARWQALACGAAS